MVFLRFLKYIWSCLDEAGLKFSTQVPSSIQPVSLKNKSHNHHTKFLIDRQGSPQYIVKQYRTIYIINNVYILKYESLRLRKQLILFNFPWDFCPYKI